MTRFARAKGSKSSNERLPNDPTPWHVMKQQLEVASEKKKEPETKVKSAKQLLNEKDDIYYAKSLGNVATDWAEFEKPKPKNTILEDGKVQKKHKDQSKKLKNVVEKSILEETNTKDLEKKETLSSKKEKKRKKKLEEPNQVKTINNKNTNDDSKQSNYDQFKNKKRKRIESISKNESENENKDEIEQSAGSKKSKNIEKNQEKSSSENFKKLSKRQKRNQRKLNHKNEDGKKESNNATFNTQGNNWNNSVKFNEKRKFDNKIDKDSLNNKVGNKDKWSDFEQKNYYRFGNNVPKKFQRKVAKVRDDNEYNRRKPDTSVKVTINGMDVEIVKYDGFPVKKEDGERLTQLRKEMVLKGIPKNEIDVAMKLERRKCEKALARIRKQVCFHCRKAGHNLSDCPELGKEEAGTGICFKCGSTEHTHFECKVTKSDDYRYAKCFICREQGHIAKQCPDNPKGLYPDGGSCKICGDVTHLKKDCPDLVKEKEETAITLDTITGANIELLGNERLVETQTKTNKKIIKF